MNTTTNIHNTMFSLNFKPRIKLDHFLIMNKLRFKEIKIFNSIALEVVLSK